MSARGVSDQTKTGASRNAFRDRGRWECVPKRERVRRASRSYRGVRSSGSFKSETNLFLFLWE